LVRWKGKDQIEFGYKNYTEANYGSSPGATPTTLYRVGHITELTPVYDPELNRVFALRDGSEAGRPIAILSRKENVALRLSWLQATIGDYWQTSMLSGENYFAEAKLYRASGTELYLYWAGLKLDKLSVRCSIGEPMQWSAELIGKLLDTKSSTIHSYGASMGLPWEWDDTYIQVSTNGTNWSLIPDVTDWLFSMDNQLKPNHVFNSTGSKQLSSLEEMEQLCSARLTMNFQDDTYLSYLLDQTEIYLKLILPDSKYLQLNRGRMRLVEPVLKPEDLIACRVEYEGGYLTHGF